MRPLFASPPAALASLEVKALHRHFLGQDYGSSSDWGGVASQDAASSDPGGQDYGSASDWGDAAAEAVPQDDDPGAAARLAQADADEAAYNARPADEIYNDAGEFTGYSDDSPAAPSGPTAWDKFTGWGGDLFGGAIRTAAKTGAEQAVREGTRQAAQRQREAIAQGLNPVDSSSLSLLREESATLARLMAQVSGIQGQTQLLYSKGTVEAAATAQQVNSQAGAARVAGSQALGDVNRALDLASGGATPAYVSAQASASSSFQGASGQLQAVISFWNAQAASVLGHIPPPKGQPNFWAAQEASVMSLFLPHGAKPGSARPGPSWVMPAVIVTAFAGAAAFGMGLLGRKR